MIAPKEAVDLVTTASAGGDRWLFVALLLACGLAVVWLFRWLVGTYTRTVEKLSGVVEANTEALREVCQAVEICRKRGYRSSGPSDD